MVLPNTLGLFGHNSYNKQGHVGSTRVGNWIEEHALHDQEIRHQVMEKRLLKRGLSGRVMSKVTSHSRVLAHYYWEDHQEDEDTNAVWAFAAGKDRIRSGYAITSQIDFSSPRQKLRPIPPRWTRGEAQHQAEVLADKLATQEEKRRIDTIRGMPDDPYVTTTTRAFGQTVKN